MNLPVPNDCELRRVKVSPFEAKMTAIPYNLLQNRLNTYGKIAREDVYAAWVMMCADGSVTKQKVHNLESYFRLIHPTNVMAGVSELVSELLRQIRGEMGSADHMAGKSFPDEFFRGALLDPRLVGVWRQADYYSSGDFYATTYTYMEFLADGRFGTGSRVNVSATHRFASGASGGNTSGTSAAGVRYAGTWETEGDILVLRPVLGAAERLHYRADNRGLLTWKHAGQKKLYVRVAG
jgi:hypothetical protein